MKTIFEFDSENEVDKRNYFVYDKAIEMLTILKELDDNLYTQLNSNSDEMSEEMYEFIVNYNNYFMSLIKKYLGIKNISKV